MKRRFPLALVLAMTAFIAATATLQTVEAQVPLQVDPDKWIVVADGPGGLVTWYEIDKRTGQQTIIRVEMHTVPVVTQPPQPPVIPTPLGNPGRGPDPVPGIPPSHVPPQFPQSGTPSQTPTPVTTSTAIRTPTPPIVVSVPIVEQGWYVRPGVTVPPAPQEGPIPERPRCPDPGQWLLLYWIGKHDASIQEAAGSCSDAGPYWTNRSGKWLGYSPANPEAGDIWNVASGEAHFIRGVGGN
jgi:hypothetical protein